MATGPYVSYYRTLGLLVTASEDDIHSAYRSLARQYHPDVNKSEGAEEKFKRIKDAYDMLTKLPVISVSLSPSTVTDLDPSYPTVDITIEVNQTGGPPFDLQRHRLGVIFGEPWGGRQVRLDKNKGVLPITFEYRLDLSGLSPDWDQTYSGEIEVTVKRKAG